jgi:hypothetical protein
MLPERDTKKTLKPDLEAYTRQKEAALGLVPGPFTRRAVKR